MDIILCTSSASRHFRRLSCNLGGANTHPQTITKNMRHSLQLLQNTARITLFTRSNCSLCDSAKLVLRKVAEKRSFDLHEINVMDSNQKKWKDLYEYDTPVVHIQRVFHRHSNPDIATDPRTLMHRFTENQVELLIDEVEGHQ